MTKKEAIEKSIEHWERMIIWVEKQPPSKNCSPWIMEDKINETWGSHYCALCRLYYTNNIKSHCHKCPLWQNFGPCTIKDDIDFTPANYWDAVAKSKTWGEWLKNAGNMLEQLKALR